MLAFLDEPAALQHEEAFTTIHADDSQPYMLMTIISSPAPAGQLLCFPLLSPDIEDPRHSNHSEPASWVVVVVSGSVVVVSA